MINKQWKGNPGRFHNPSKHNLLYGRKVMPNISSIYKITCLVNLMIYIGFTSRDPSSRWRHYRTQPHGYIGRAIRKYGIENFSFEVIYQSWDPNHTLNTMEPYFIQKFDSYRSKFGYNLTLGGDASLGYVPSSETREKIRAANLGKKQSLETTRKRSESLKRCYSERRRRNTFKEISYETRAMHWKRNSDKLIEGRRNSKKWKDSVTSDEYKKKKMLADPRSRKVFVDGILYHSIRDASRNQSTFSYGQLRAILLAGGNDIVFFA